MQDHLLLVNEELTAQRDLLGTVLEADMAVISVEQTKVSIRQSTTIASGNADFPYLHHHRKHRHAQASHPDWADIVRRVMARAHRRA